MKLDKILKEVIGKKVITTPQIIEPGDNANASWKVDYSPDFTGIVKSYNRLIIDFSKSLKSNNLENDPTMHDILVKMKGNREFLHKTLKRKYPDHIEKLSKR